MNEEELDEDIQYLKDLISLALLLPNGECTIQEREIEAISNVVIELEKYRNMKCERS